MENDSRVALVTGGSRGIGKAIVEELAALGWKVGFTYSASGAIAQEIVQQASGRALTVKAYQADVKNYDRAAEVTAQMEQELGPIDLLVNNAGIKRDTALYRMEPEAWRDVIDTNLGGTFNYCRAVVYGMIKRHSGTIVNIVSVSGIIGLSGQTNYSASKAGVIGFTKALSKEVARFDIRVNAVAPGFIETDMLGTIPEDAKKKMFAQIPMGSPGTPRQVAQVVSFLASPAAAYITGQVLPVDGGMV